jgi:hypothetical protein
VKHIYAHRNSIAYTIVHFIVHTIVHFHRETMGKFCTVWQTEIEEILIDGGLTNKK